MSSICHFRTHIIKFTSSHIIIIYAYNLFLKLIVFIIHGVKLARYNHFGALKIFRIRLKSELFKEQTLFLAAAEAPPNVGKKNLNRSQPNMLQKKPKKKPAPKPKNRLKKPNRLQPKMQKKILIPIYPSKNNGKLPEKPKLPKNAKTKQTDSRKKLLNKHRHGKKNMKNN